MTRYRKPECVHVCHVFLFMVVQVDATDATHTSSTQPSPRPHDSFKIPRCLGSRGSNKNRGGRVLLPTWDDEGELESSGMQARRTDGCSRMRGAETEKKPLKDPGHMARGHCNCLLLLLVLFHLISVSPQSPICNKVVETSGCARRYLYALDHPAEPPSCLGIVVINTWTRSSLIRIPYSTNEPQFEMFICKDFVILTFSSMEHGTTREFIISLSPALLVERAKPVQGFKTYDQGFASMTTAYHDGTQRLGRSMASRSAVIIDHKYRGIALASTQRDLAQFSRGSFDPSTVEIVRACKTPS